MDSPRWPLMWDMNLDGVVSISDVWLWLGWLLHLPGDITVAMLATWPAAVTFLELSPDSYGNWSWTLASSVVWLAALFVVPLFTIFMISEVLVAVSDAAFGAADRVRRASRDTVDSYNEAYDHTGAREWDPWRTTGLWAFLGFLAGLGLAVTNNSSLLILSGAFFGGVFGLFIARVRNRFVPNGIGVSLGRLVGGAFRKFNGRT